MIKNLSVLDPDSTTAVDTPVSATGTTANSPESWVKLVDGSTIDLGPLTVDELDQLHWEQERAFAKQIKDSRKGTPQRSQMIQTAYQSVCGILENISQKCGESEFAMGMDHRYTQFVISQLNQLEKAGIQGGLFEVGFGSGLLLDSVAQAGHDVGGLEVAPQLLEDAKSRLPAAMHEKLCFGNFLENEAVDSLVNQFSLVYWNDVFEHIPVDEISDYLDRIFALLVPGGQLVTITPNWHMRPMDVTADFLGPRTTAIGFHLKEYRLGEVCELLRASGFNRIETPLFIGKQKITMNRWLSWTRAKCWMEPLLEWLPYSWAVQCCRRLGFTLTVATKPKST